MKPTSAIALAIMINATIVASDASGSAFCVPNRPGAPTYCGNIPYKGKPVRSMKKEILLPNKGETQEKEGEIKMNKIPGSVLYDKVILSPKRVGTEHIKVPQIQTVKQNTSNVTQSSPVPEEQNDPAKNLPAGTLRQ